MNRSLASDSTDRDSRNIPPPERKSLARKQFSASESAVRFFYEIEIALIHRKRDQATIQSCVKRECIHACICTLAT